MPSQETSQATKIVNKASLTFTLCRNEQKFTSDRKQLHEETKSDFVTEFGLIRRTKNFISNLDLSYCLSYID